MASTARQSRSARGSGSKRPQPTPTRTLSCSSVTLECGDHIGAEAPDALQLLLEARARRDPEAEDHVLRPDPVAELRDLVDAVLGAADDQPVLAVVVEEEVLLLLDALQERLALRDPARHLREVEPVLRADRRPPDALDLVEVVPDPAVAQQHDVLLALGPELLAEVAVLPGPVLHDVEVVQGVRAPRQPE